MQISLKQAIATVFALSLATIAGAWGFELIGGYIPCHLCLQQRWPYYIVVPLSALLLVVARRLPGVARVGLVLCALVMLAGAGLGVYQSGAEWGFWPGPQACAGGGGLSGGLPDLANAVVVRCDEAQWRMFGLSFAGWNVVVSLLIAAIAVAGALGQRTVHAR